MYKMKLSDLRYLASYGNATVKFDASKDFRVGDIKRDGVYIPEHHAIVRGKRANIKIRETFPKCFAHIQTVKLGKVLVAERKKGQLIATWKFEEMIKDNAKKVKGA